METRREAAREFVTGDVVPGLGRSVPLAVEQVLDELCHRDRIAVDRWVLDTPVPPYFRLLAKFAKQDRVDRWMNTVFTPPSFVRIDIGAAWGWRVRSPEAPSVREEAAP